MKTKILILTATLSLASFQVFAERIIPQGPRSHFSENKQYEIQVFERTIVDGACKITFKKEGQVLWERNLPSTPGIVNVSNDGQSIVFVNWGWADEGGFKSVSFYDNGGHERKEFRFGSGDDVRNMKHIRVAKLTPDGQRFLIVDSLGAIVFYDIKTPSILWERKLPKPQSGYYELDDVKISEFADFILLSAYNVDNTEALFEYLNKEGDTILEKRIPKGYPIRNGLFGIVVYINENHQKFIELDVQGKKFSVYSLPESRWVQLENNGGKVAEVH